VRRQRCQIEVDRLVAEFTEEGARAGRVGSRRVAGQDARPFAADAALKIVLIDTVAWAAVLLKAALARISASLIVLVILCSFSILILASILVFKIDCWGKFL
jgi:hypothetical protein